MGLLYGVTYVVQIIWGCLFVSLYLEGLENNLRIAFLDHPLALKKFAKDFSCEHIHGNNDAGGNNELKPCIKF